MAPPVVAIGLNVANGLEELLRDSGVPMETFRLKGYSEDELIESVGRADAFVIGPREAVTARVLRALPRCRIVCRSGVGVDNVDLDAATELGVLVTCVPDASVEEVSEHAVAMMLAFARRLFPLDRAIKSGEWARPGSTVPASIRGGMRRLKGQRLGIVGFGRIGRATWAKLKAFGLSGLVYDPMVPAEAVRAEGAEPVGWQELLETSDFITVHTPLTPESHQMFDREAFERMKPTAFLINTARGAIVGEDALVEAIRAGQIAGAGIDVTLAEPLPADSSLTKLDQVILTGHSAFASREASDDLRRGVARSLVDFFRGDVPRGLVNTDALDSRKAQQN